MQQCAKGNTCKTFKGDLKINFLNSKKTNKHQQKRTCSGENQWLNRIIIIDPSFIEMIIITSYKTDSKYMTYEFFPVYSLLYF